MATCVFLMNASEEFNEFFGAIAEEMVAHFGVSYAEAVARINCHWCDITFTDHADIIFHQTSDYWAARILFEDVFEHGTLRKVVRDAPPVGSNCWTIAP